VQPPAGPPAPTVRVAPTDAAELPFAAGQRLFARVVQILSPASAVLDLAGQRLSTSTPVPLTAGQVLEVTVRAVAPLVELDLVEAPQQISEDAYALAAVLQAKQAAPRDPRVTREEIGALLRALADARVPKGQEDRRDDLVARATAALTPAALGPDGVKLVDGLQRAVVASGVFLEGRLAAASRTARADVGALQDDLKAVLAELSVLTNDSPVPEQTRLRLMDEVLARQIDVAYHKVRHDELRMDVPLLAGETPADVQLRVRDAPDDAHPDSPGGRHIDLRLELSNLGAVRASIAWIPGHLTTRFTVSEEIQAERLRSGFDALAARLQGIGFRHAAVAVDVDPSGLREPYSEPDPPLPGGSILRVRV
jgi:hypothetical protein